MAARLEGPESFPSILVVAEEELRKYLVRDLEAGGYLVFEAGNRAAAFHVVISQSRPIHILLADVKMNAHDLAAALEPYRPEMHALFVASHPQSPFDVLSPDAAVAKIQEILKPPKELAAQAMARRSAGRKFLGMTA